MINVSLYSYFLFLSISFLLHHSLSLPKPLCRDADRFSLLQFKESFVFDKFSCDPSTDYTKLSSWKVRDDCCSWDGVECDGETGHVIGLNLSSSCLYGSINSSSPLFRLVHLTSLDLSYNNLSGLMPVSIENLKSLSTFKARGCGFEGPIPSSIGNLTQLKVLDLYQNYFTGEIPSCFGNMFKLSYLSLSYNNFSSSTLHWLSKLTNLYRLGLTKTNSYGVIPSSFQNLTRLAELWLSSNQLAGQLPSWLGNFTQLTKLLLSDNELQGPIPDSIFRLPNIEFIELDSNKLSGSLETDSFLQSKYLSDLQLSNNHLSLISSKSMNVTLPKFKFLGLNACNLTEFPAFLRGQRELEALQLSHNNINGYVPNWLSALERLSLLDLSLNFLTGFENPPSATLPWTNLNVLNLASNELEGSLPIPPPSITTYEVAQNKFNGDISLQFCNLPTLLILDLSENNLNGNLPHCLGNLGSTSLALNLRGNSLRGEIPDNFSIGCAFVLMDFSQNKFEGKVPMSLANCSKLEILSFEENQMNDVFPSWLGILPHLRVLSLRSNKFHGVIGKPLSKFDFGHLHIIDLSGNDFRGKLPLVYIQNWVAMKNVGNDHLSYMQKDTIFEIPGYRRTLWYKYSIRIVIKGTKRAYDRILEFFVVVDLSSNRFEGEIPEIIGTLKELQSLNLSNNILTAHIPPSLGNLTKLEALDLSLNNLSGEIPTQLASLTFLAIFNVSHNSLTGPVPKGNQFDTFNSDSFSANPGLCSDRLSKKCGNTQTLPLPPPEAEDSDSTFEFNWELGLIGFSSGLVIGASIGYAMDTRKYEWQVKKKFTRRRRR